MLKISFFGAATIVAINAAYALPPTTCVSNSRQSLSNVTTVARPAEAAPLPDAKPVTADTALSQVLRDAVQRGDVPAIVGLVVNRDEVLFEGGAAAPTNSIFSIASMTKPVTSVAIVMLAEQGKLSIDDPVSKYLAGFDHLRVITKFNEKNGTYKTRPAKSVMTIRHLLTHTAGIGYGFTSPMLARLNGDYHKPEWEFPLLSDPGAQWHYGASTRILGLIVEKVTGQDLETWFQKHIFQPLGMADTSFAVPKDKQSRVVTPVTHAEGHFKVVNGIPPVPDTPKPPFLGDGGLYSTAHDYGLFIRMFLNGGQLDGVRILSEQSVKEMSNNQIGAVFVTLQPNAMPEIACQFPLGAGHDKFGLGFQIAADTTDAKKYRRSGSLSWSGLFNTEFWIDPQSGIGGVLLMQFLPFYDGGAIRTLREFEATTYREFGL